MKFDKFDHEIGFEGYCNAIRDSLYPDATPQSIDVATLNLKSRSYPMGSIFSRVRGIDNSELDKFLSRTVLTKEFLPAKQTIKKAKIGRFNNEGERKLYLADHPYVAMKECGISPGQHFLFSYFSFEADTFFIEPNSDNPEASHPLIALLRSKDREFYPVINYVYNKYLNFDGFHGIVYDSVRVPKDFNDKSWETINSTANLVMKEEDLASVKFIAGWLAICDDNYRPGYLRSFYPTLNPKKKNKLTTVHYQDRPKFSQEHGRAMREVFRLRESAQIRKDNNECALAPSTAIKFNYKD